MNESTIMEEILTVKSAETCFHDHLHSMRKELRAQLAAECIIHECGNHWGREEKQNIQYGCDSASALSQIDEKGRKRKSILMQEKLT